VQGTKYSWNRFSFLPAILIGCLVYFVARVVYLSAVMPCLHDKSITKDIGPANHQTKMRTAILSDTWLGQVRPRKLTLMSNLRNVRLEIRLTPISEKGAFVVDPVCNGC
jgi:hypothetical protein